MPNQENQPKDRPPQRSVFSFFRKCFPKTLSSSKKTIAPNLDGFTLLLDGNPNWSLRWYEVTAIVAYKQDLFSVDLICFGFRIKDDQLNFRCIDENTPGYKSIVDQITKITNNAWPDRFEKIAQPAFEQCWTVLRIADGSPPLDENPNLHMIDPPTD